MDASGSDWGVGMDEITRGKNSTERAWDRLPEMSI